MAAIPLKWPTEENLLAIADASESLAASVRNNTCTTDPASPFRASKLGGDDYGAIRDAIRRLGGVLLPSDPAIDTAMTERGDLRESVFVMFGWTRGWGSNVNAALKRVLRVWSALNERFATLQPVDETGKLFAKVPVVAAEYPAPAFASGVRQGKAISVDAELEIPAGAPIPVEYLDALQHDARRLRAAVAAVTERDAAAGGPDGDQTATRLAAGASGPDPDGGSQGDTGLAFGGASSGEGDTGCAGPLGIARSGNAADGPYVAQTATRAAAAGASGPELQAGAAAKPFDAAGGGEIPPPSAAHACNGNTTKPKKSTQRGEARAKLIAALSLHHKYQEGSCLNTEPIGCNELARQAQVSQGSATPFFKAEFKGYSAYRVVCRDPGRLAESLKVLNGEFSPQELYGRNPPGESADDGDE